MRVRRPLIVLAMLIALPALTASSAAQASIAPIAHASTSTPLFLAHHRSRRHHEHAPLITSQPVSETVSAGGQASFSVTAGGSPAPKVRWELSSNHGRSWSAIGRAHAPTISLSVLVAENGYEYRAIFANRAGSATSRAATLTVTSPPPSLSTTPPATPPSTGATSPVSAAGPSTSTPSVTEQPTSVTVASGASVSFSTAASGSPAPTVQWQVSTDGAQSWSDVSGATSTTYAFIASTGGAYRAVFTNSAGSATSATATLSVTSSSPVAPQITLQPSDQTVAGGSSASFAAGASGYPAPTVQWQVSVDGGQTWSDVAGATSDNYSFAADASENANEYRAVFTNSVTSATSDAAGLTVVEPSSNWSGYFADGATFTSVSGSWIVPTLACGSQTAFSSQWIGIDGANSPSVEQDGTEADCYGGQAYYNAWYEMYGDTQNRYAYYDEVPLSGCTPDPNCTVSGGDAMSAQVSVTGSDWTLAIDDVTAGWTFTTTIDSPTPTPTQSSAEWIVERPSIGSANLPPLANFASTTFTNASATAGASSGSISAFSYAPIAMVSNDGSSTLATPGALSAGGTSFTDTWVGSGP